MKKNLFVILAALSVLPSCRHHVKMPEENIPYSTLIPIDTANKMIKSYLDGVNCNENPEAIKALRFDADSLRAYLSDPHIKNIKFVFANTLAYANSPYSGKRPPLNSHVLTIILAGYDEFGNYVYKNNQVYENCFPCPNNCGPGQSGEDYLAQ